MSKHRYEAYWIPGLDSDFDPDEALRLGFEWLDESAHPAGPVIVLYAASMIRNRRMLEWGASRYPVVSPRTRTGPRGPAHAVLAVWPTTPTLEFAERLALDGGLCVIPNSRDEMTSWIVRTSAVNLADPDSAPPSALRLPEEARKALDSTLFFDGHNSFVGAGGKEHAIRTLRRIAALSQKPKAKDVEAYALESGETDYEGAGRLARWYEGIVAGRSFRDYRGRVI